MHVSLRTSAHTGDAIPWIWRAGEPKPSPPGKVAREARRKRATSGKLQKYIDILESCMKNPAFVVRKVCKPSSAPVCATSAPSPEGKAFSLNPYKFLFPEPMRYRLPFERARALTVLPREP